MNPIQPGKTPGQTTGKPEITENVFETRIVLQEAKEKTLMLWEPYSGSPASLVKAINHCVDCWEQRTDPTHNAEEFIKPLVANGLRGNFIGDVRTFVGLADVPFPPRWMALTEDEKKTGAAKILDFEVNGLLHGIHANLWGIELLINQAEKHGVRREEILSWSPDPDISGNSVTSKFKADWKEHMPEYLQDGKLPTLGKMVELMQTTVKRYNTKRLDTLGEYPK